MFKRSMTALLALGAASLSATSAWACLWYYGTKLDHSPVNVNDAPPEAYLRRLTDHRTHEERRRATLGPEPAADSDFKMRSDYAASLLYKGEVSRAVELLESVEKQKPGEYVVATNLGTAYELAGDNPKALQWINEGIRRNRQSHYGTEWLHALILEAKIELTEDPDWLKSNTVLGLDFGAEPLPVAPARWGKGSNPQETQHALEYQLHERMGFVPAPDPIVADLLMSLADTLAVSHTVEHAAAVYDLALTYTPARAELAMKRRDALRTVAANRRSVWHPGRAVSLYGPRMLMAVAVAAGGVALLLHVRRRRSAAA